MTGFLSLTGGKYHGPYETKHNYSLNRPRTETVRVTLLQEGQVD